MHPVRQLQLRLPAQRDPLEVLRQDHGSTVRRPGSRRRRSTPWACRTPATPCRSTSRTAPGCGLCVEACPAQAPARPDAQGDQPRRSRAAGRAGTREHRVLRDAAGQRALPRRLRHGARHTVPGAAVRVLRGVRRLRRDALRQAALAVVRRPADGGQRHRLLVDLRRQPADDAVDHERRRARTRLVELAVRGQRRVRAGPAASPPTCTPNSPARG